MHLELGRVQHRLGAEKLVDRLGLGDDRRLGRRLLVGRDVVSLDGLVAARGAGGATTAAAPAVGSGGGGRLRRIELVVAGRRGQRAVTRVRTHRLAGLRRRWQHYLSGGGSVVEAAVGQAPWLVVMRGPRRIGDLGGRRARRRVRTYVVDAVGPEAGVHGGGMSGGPALRSQLWAFSAAAAGWLVACARFMAHGGGGSRAN